MPKKVKTIIKLQIAAGQATPAPPVGPALGQHGLNIQEFCSQFNEATRPRAGEVVPVELTVFEDRTFFVKLKEPAVSELLKKAAKAEKGSSEPHKKKVANVTRAQVREIAERKLPDLGEVSVEAAMKMVEGTARSMGITVE